MVQSGRLLQIVDNVDHGASRMVTPLSTDSGTITCPLVQNESASYDAV